MKKIVMCFGAFDGLHAGHEDYLRQAKDFGDELIVVVARDATVVDLEGDLPNTNEQERLDALQNHPLVDDARLGYPDDKYRIIEEVRPDIICLGYDQEAFTDRLDAELARRGIASSVMRLQAYEPELKHALLRGARTIDDDFSEEFEYEENGLPL